MGGGKMKKLSAPKALLYLQERYEDFLQNNLIDIIEKKRGYFYIGRPSFKDSGTFSWEVHPQKKGGILVKTHIWDEGRNNNNGDGKYLEDYIYTDIDDWMEMEGYRPSSRKSRPKNDYRK